MSNLESKPVATGQLFREYWPAWLAISALILLPCFWHQHIEAGDLASHVYNAWLVQLIHHGQADGLSIVHQDTNVLFDLMLSGIGSVFGLALAEKFSVGIATLIFFWGAFAFVCAASHRVPWFLLPVVAMVTYGWTFHAGFFNYYLSIGLSFWALAIFWERSGLRRLIFPILISPLIVLASPLGLVWFCGFASYIVLSEVVPRRFHALLLLAPAAVVFSARFYIGHHYRFGNLPKRNTFLILGVHQVVLFGPRYQFLAATVLFFGLVCLLCDAWTRRREPGYWAQYVVPLQLYIIAEMVMGLLPSTIYLPQYPAAVADLTERLTSISVILLCVFVGIIRFRKWHAAGFTMAGLVFFSFLYQDTATINRMENHVQELVSALPRGSRVLATISWRPDWPSYFIIHIVDRACVGRCFSFGNYEPSAGEFRVRAAIGNRIVMADSDDTGDMERGVYVMKATDLPAYQIYQCSSDFTVLCIRQLQEGEENDRLGVHAAGSQY